MTIARAVAFVVLVVFGGFSAWVALETSYWGAFPPFGDWNTTQIFSDLVVAANIVLFLLAKQRWEQQRPIWPIGVVAVGVALLGSIALLVWLVVDKTSTQLSQRPMADRASTPAG